MEYKVYNIIVRTLKTNFAVLSERPKGGGLENRWAERPRGFESYIRRHKIDRIKRTNLGFEALGPGLTRRVSWDSVGTFYTVGEILRIYPSWFKGAVC